MQRNTRKALALGLIGLATTMAAPSTLAAQGDWLIRGGATMVDPKSNSMHLGNLDGGAGQVIIGDAVLNVDDAIGFGFNVTYMLTGHIGIELLGAAPFRHDIDVCCTVDGTSGCVKLDETKQLPPTLSLQYHFLP